LKSYQIFEISINNKGIFEKFTSASFGSRYGLVRRTKTGGG
jgi:hypothetical protein